MDNMAHGELPGRELVYAFLARHGNALSANEVRAALTALKGTDFEQNVLAEAAAWAEAEVDAILAEQARVEAEARQAAEEAERRPCEQQGTAVDSSDLLPAPASVLAGFRRETAKTAETAGVVPRTGERDGSCQGADTRALVVRHPCR
jgi:hypothetical protein